MRQLKRDILIMLLSIWTTVQKNIYLKRLGFVLASLFIFLINLIVAYLAIFTIVQNPVTSLLVIIGLIILSLFITFIITGEIENIGYILVAWIVIAIDILIFGLFAIVLLEDVYPYLITYYYTPQ